MNLTKWRSRFDPSVEDASLAGEPYIKRVTGTEDDD